MLVCAGHSPALQEHRPFERRLQMSPAAAGLARKGRDSSTSRYCPKPSSGTNRRRFQTCSPQSESSVHARTRKRKHSWIAARRKPRERQFAEVWLVTSAAALAGLISNCASRSPCGGQGLRSQLHPKRVAPSALIQEV